ncbi:hypothetical protein QBC39DRAFT_270306 [Podospora conica]|nr:hypothetical protein QBC39DRAFT_270306 [Schizothecium conicum]
MAKIAKAVAMAFTKGRKSAPAEFREVENQLYSLSAALSAFQDATHSSDASTQLSAFSLSTSQQDEGATGQNTIAGMLGNCSETLKHLEKIVDKYGVISQSSDPQRSRLQRWSQDLVRNYKKIAWTTEAGDLATLRSQLLVHTNSLDLVLGIVINSRTARIEDTLKQSSERLEEIYSWWAENMRVPVATPRSVVVAPQQLLAENISPPLPPVVTFGVYLETSQGPRLVCPEASLHDDWRESGASQLFSCQCPAVKEKEPRHREVESVALSPMSFPYRLLGGERSWVVFKTSGHANNVLASIIIKGVPIGDTAEFEESFVQTVSSLQAVAMLGLGMSTVLVHPSPDRQHVRVLNLRADITTLGSFVDTVTLSVGHRSLPRGNIDNLAMVHYRELSAKGSPRIGSGGLDYAEVGIKYHQDDESGEGDDGVARNELQCAKLLYQKLEDMRMELFILSLEYPRADETVALHLQVTQVQCEEICIADAEMIITRSKLGDGERFRLTIRSRNRCTILSQICDDAFFADDTARGTGKGASAKFKLCVASPTWLVQMESPGVRKVYHYPNGFRFLNFNSVHAEKMFELGRMSISLSRDED